MRNFHRRNREDKGKISLQERIENRILYKPNKLMKHEIFYRWKGRKISILVNKARKDSKVLIRSSKSKDTQYNGQKKTNNDISKLKIDQHEPH
jgi:tRNA A37 methylthiotransferase MiaB